MINKKIITSTGANLDHGWESEFGDARLDTPTFHRNHNAIAHVLQEYIGSACAGIALEIGSGSGQHIMGFAEKFPELRWLPSDPDHRHRASIAAWKQAQSAGNVSPPIDLDASTSPWHLSGVDALQAVVCINVLHITPWIVTEGIFAGAGQLLVPGASMFIYGPFKQNGAHTAESNAAFDVSLHNRNPAWGIRDIAELEALANRNRLSLNEAAPMPANNFTLVFQRNSQSVLSQDRIQD